MQPALFRDRPVLKHIVEQHAEEAAFLWTLRDAATEAPHYNTEHLTRLNERLEAHVDGLRIAGEQGWRVALEQLERRCQKGEMFTAAVLALESGDLRRVERVAAQAMVEPEARRGLVGAVAWCPPKLLAASVRAWHRSPQSFERYLALCASSVHRADPGPGYEAYLDDNNELVRARALRLAGELGRLEHCEACLRGLADTADEPRFWAAWSSVLLGNRGDALDALEAMSLVEGPRRWFALETAVRAMGLKRGSHFAWVLSREQSQHRATAVALGHLGVPASIPWLIAHMGEFASARLAGEAFSMITGADLTYEDLDQDGPAVPGTVPDEDLEDAGTVPDPDADLPWPNPVRIGVWWAEKHSRYLNNRRYLFGGPIDTMTCARTLTGGYQRQRRAACLEVRLGGGAGPLLTWRGRSAQQ